MTIPEPELVSVIIPTYNHARFIGKAVESVLRQNYEAHEIIVVDNYSQDGTAEIVSAYGDPRVKYVKFANKGIIAASRNYGVSLARGKYTAFLDSDDLWLPEKLTLQLQAFARSGDTVMVYSRFKTISDDAVSGQVFPKAQRCISGDIFRALYRRHFIACSGVMVRKNVLEKVGGFDESPAMVAAEDADLWLKIALAGQIQCASDAPLFLYRIHTSNFSRGYFERYKRALMIILKHRKNAGFINLIEAFALLSASIIRQKLEAMCGAPR